MKEWRTKKLSVVLATIMLMTLFPVTLFSQGGGAATVKAADEGENLVANGTFDSDLSDWTDAAGSITQDNGAMKIVLDGTATAHIRTDIAICAEVGHTVSFDMKTDASARVELTVYEYTFDNKIVRRHTAVAEGPAEEYRTGSVSFTTSEVTDTLGLVFGASGAAGNVYVDNVRVLAAATGIIASDPDDVNNSGSAGPDDLVHMKKAVANGIENLTLKKYADRNGDGVFDEKDTGTLRERLVGKSRDDFTATNATASAVGVKMKPVAAETEEEQVMTGDGIAISKSTGKVQLTTTKAVSADYYPYVMTEAEYGSKHFEFTIDLEEGKAPNLYIGARIHDSANYMYSMGGHDGGAVILLNDFFFNVRSPKGFWNSTDTAAHYKDENTKLGGTCTFGVDVKREGEKDILYFTVKKEGELICNKTFDVTGVPDSGKFVVWSTRQTSSVISYCIGEPASREEQEDRSTAYFTTGGEYATETFAFETDMTYTEDDKLYVGARMDGTVVRDRNAVTGLTISFHTDANNTYVQTYAPRGEWNGAETFVLKGNETYKFFLKVTDNEDSTKTLHLSAWQDGKYVDSFDHTYTAEQSAFIPGKGAFALWSTGKCRDVVYNTLPKEPTPSVVIEKCNEADAVEVGTTENAGTYSNGYLAVKGDYKSEHFTFTTTIRDKTSPNLSFGSRMQSISENWATCDGLRYSVSYDSANDRDIYELLLVKDGAANWLAANVLPMETGKTYTFDLSVRTAGTKSEAKLIVSEAESGTIICDKTHEIDMTTYAVPKSGNFMVWTNEIREIGYRVPYKVADPTNIRIEEDETAGTATVQTSDNGWGALAAIGGYSEEYFEFTTTITDNAKPNLVIGARVSDDYGTSPGTANAGLMIDLYNTFYQVYYNTYGTLVKAYNYGDEGAWSDKNPFISGQKYTFGVKLYEEAGSIYMSLIIRQGDSLVYKYTKCNVTEMLAESGAALPAAGNFVVWTKESRSISYEMPEKTRVGQNVKVARTEDSGNARVVKITVNNYGTANYLEMTGPYAKDSFTFKTKVTAGNEEGHMVIGARVAAPGEYWCSSGDGLFIRLADSAFDVYYNGANCKVWHRSYDGGGSLAVGQECTVTLTVDDSNLIFHVMQEGGIDSTNTVSVDNLGIPESGAFAVWKLDTYFTIDYNITPGQATDIPDYSASTLSLDVYAHIGPSNGIYYDESGAWYGDGTDYQTAEEYARYKACGFNTILMHGDDAYMSPIYYTSRGQSAQNNNNWYLNQKMVACHNAGLKLIVFDAFIHDLAASETPLVGEGCRYASDEALEQDIRESMKFYYDKDNPGVWPEGLFKGIALADEPTHKQFAAYADVIRVIQHIAEEDGREIYIHTVLLPFNGTKKAFYEAYTGKTYSYITGMFANMKSAYSTYVSDYLDNVSDPVFSLDVYPILSDTPYVAEEYFYNLQHTVNAAAKKGKAVNVTIQSMGNTNSKNADPTAADIRFQLNTALGFGVKDIRYYTYWAFPDRSKGYTSSIVDKNGNDVIYHEVKAANADAGKLAKVILNFDYVKTAVSGSGSGFTNLVTSPLNHVTIASATAPTIVNQLQDKKNNRTGYMVLNAAAPSAGTEDTVKLAVTDYDFATCYVKGVPETKALPEGVLTLQVPAGEGVFVILHN